MDSRLRGNDVIRKPTPPNLTGDRADLNFDVLLAMAGSALAVFSSTKFLNKYLLTFGFANDFRRYAGTGYDWFTKLESTIGRNGEYTVECQGIANIHITEIDFQRLAFFDFVLASAVSYNRVHFLTVIKKKDLNKKWTAETVLWNAKF